MKVRKNIANVSKGVEHSATELRLQKMVLSSLKDSERSKKEELNDYRRSIQDALVWLFYVNHSNLDKLKMHVACFDVHNLFVNYHAGGFDQYSARRSQTTS